MKRSLFLLLVIPLVLFSQTLRFAPLPMLKSELTIRQYENALHYLHEKTGITFEMVYFANYDKLLEGIENGQVDIAHLGPLPYAKLLMRTEGTKPIVQFLNARGESRYTCSYFTLKRYQDIFKKQSLEPVALTQPLSTCGFLSVASILQKHGRKLEKMHYRYSGTHSQAVLDVVLGDAKTGGVKTSVYYDYEHLGLQELGRTHEFPGFLWVASANVSDRKVDSIRRALLSLDPLHNEQDARVVQEWGSNIKHGAIKAEKKNYEIIAKMLEDITIPELAR